MGLQWQIVAGFLYLEVGFVFLLCTGFIAPARWKKIFNSRFVLKLKAVASTFFYAALLVLIVMFVDSINKMFKYRARLSEARNPLAGAPIGGDPSAQMFLAQRNMYITGFTLFLLLVVNRLIRLVSDLAGAIAREEASLQQAKSASTQAQKLMKENEDLQRGKSRSATSSQDSGELADLRKRLDDKCRELESAQASLEAIKSQAESTNREYDRLLKEHSKLQGESSSVSKKDD